MTFVAVEPCGVMNAVFSSSSGDMGTGDIWRRHPRKRASLARKWNPQFDLFVVRETVFWTCVIEIGVINTNSPFALFLCHVRPKMTLKGDNSCTTENCTLRVTGPAWTGSIMSPKDVVDDPLNPDKIRSGFSRPARLCPIWPTTDACTRSAELPGWAPVDIVYDSLGGDWGPRGPRVMMLRCVPSSRI
ncbi:hypothetical protein CK203_018299 [Vitis vinifera]|uniref:Uncharacterized protein n=1 Tax=Vitis vinifera TaxID=29760 RepID=A0A438JP68_VITVI|nr:hypothetical protein CK203_018299 [Vitis vinifera]